MATNRLKDQAIQLLKEPFFSEKIRPGDRPAWPEAIFYANHAASYWALQSFVDGVLLLPQLIWADDAKKVGLCVHFFASND